MGWKLARHGGNSTEEYEPYKLLTYRIYESTDWAWIVFRVNVRVASGRQPTRELAQSEAEMALTTLVSQ